MILFIGLIVLTSEIFVGSQIIPREAFERIRNFEPEKYSYAHEKEWPTWNTFFKKLAQNPNILDLDVDETCAYDWALPWNVLESNLIPNSTYANFSQQPFLEFLDSSGVIGPGILKGHQWFYGLYSECKAVSYEIPSGDHTFEGMYTRIFISQNILTKSSYSGYQTPGACESVLGLDICAPKSCSDDDLLKIIRNFTGKMANNSESPVCSVKTMRDEYFKKKDFGTWLVVAIMVIIAILGITASIYDYFIYPLHKNEPFVKSLGMKCWRAFSLYTNISETFNTKGSKKPGQIGPIHCMRFFSLCWVVMGHSLGFFMLYSSNPLDVLDITKDWVIQWVVQSYFAVDTFFFQSGLLLAFIWFKKYNANKRQTNSAMAWVMFYVHRILRLSPAYYMLIAFYTFVYIPLLNTMPVYLSPFAEPCPQYWWVNLLYLNNYIHYDKQCYLVSWYLSTDLQIYIFAPILLIPFTFGPLFGVAASFIVFLISTVANLITVIQYRFPPSDYSLGYMDPKMTTPYDHYTILIYNAPWIRCQVFIIGMLVGYLLQNKKKLKIHWAINIILWVVCFALMILNIIALRSWAGEHHYMDLGLRALYSAFCKPVWGLCLSWIIISCYYGYGSFINDFMSWNIWVPLGRLSYSSYLIHICVMLYVTGMSQNGTTYSSFPQMVLLFVLPIIAVTYFLAIFWSAAFEFGFGKVEDALIGALIGRSVRSSAVNEEAKEQIAVKKDNDNWDAESPVNGQARPAYANDIVNNNKDD